jgi:hypothetical protein
MATVWRTSSDIQALRPSNSGRWVPDMAAVAKPRQLRASTSKLDATEGERAIYVDYEGNTDVQAGISSAQISWIGQIAQERFDQGM